jgi:hypothetical protein
MNGLSGRSGRIQELANLKIEGELSAQDFDAHVAEILSYRLKDIDVEEWSEFSTAAPDEEHVECDNSIAVAGAIGIAAIAIIFIIIALEVAHQGS